MSRPQRCSASKSPRRCSQSSHYDRLPGLAADLVHRQVAVIVTGATIPTALAAKAATATIAIVFGVGDDPAKLGLVTSLARPGGNATGVNFFSVELGAKVLGLLRELVPKASRIGLFVNPLNSGNEAAARDVIAAAHAIGAHIDVVQASDSREKEAAFVTLVRNKADALLIGPDAFFYVRRIQLATLAARHAIPTVSLLRLSRLHVSAAAVAQKAWVRRLVQSGGQSIR